MNHESAKQLARQCEATWKLGPAFGGWLDFFETDIEDTETAFAVYRDLRKHSGPTMDIGRFWNEYRFATTTPTAPTTHDAHCEHCDGTGYVHTTETSPVTGHPTEYATPCATHLPQPKRKAVCGMCAHLTEPCAWCRDDIKNGTVRDWTTNPNATDSAHPQTAD